MMLAPLLMFDDFVTSLPRADAYAVTYVARFTISFSRCCFSMPPPPFAAAAFSCLPFSLLPFDVDIRHTFFVADFARLRVDTLPRLRLYLMMRYCCCRHTFRCLMLRHCCASFSLHTRCQRFFSASVARHDTLMLCYVATTLTRH